MSSNILYLRTTQTSAPAVPAPMINLIRSVRAVIEQRRLATTRRMTRRLLQDLPAIVRRDIGIPDLSNIKNIELTYQFYSLD